METDGEFCVLTVDMRRWSQPSQPKLFQPRCTLHGMYLRLYSLGVYTHCILHLGIIEVARYKCLWSSMLYVGMVINYSSCCLPRLQSRYGRFDKIMLVQDHLAGADLVRTELPRWDKQEGRPPLPDGLIQIFSLKKYPHRSMEFARRTLVSLTPW